MPYSVVFAAQPESEDELTKLGFKKKEVWIKRSPNKEKGEAELFRMKRPPFQFVVTSWWGAGPG